MIHLIGAIAGAAFVLFFVWGAKRLGTEGWSYAAALILLPIFYMGFGALAPANQGRLIGQEMLYGLPFFLGGVLLLVWRAPAALYLVAAFWGVHAFYDFGHDMFFENPGVWAIYPAFCAVIDGLMALYLITLANKQRAEAQAPA